MRMTKLLFAYLVTLLLYGFLIPTAGVKGGWFLDNLLGIPPLNFLGFKTAIGSFIILLGLFFIGWSFYSIRTIGKGHPHEIFNLKLAPATSRLIREGPYKFTRNPMCLGFVILIAGLGIFSGSLSTMILSAATYLTLGAFYLKFVEEKGLVERFGQAYLNYRYEVPMIIPGFKFKTNQIKTKRQQKKSRMLPVSRFKEQEEFEA